ncbi:MAG: hypothetical protein JWN44_4524 [Myxococcales bacterium]|nr:hypothetical protein [Myxococcales bacterium]
MWHVLVGERLISLPALALCGLGIGVIAGMFGIGGGFLLTPILHLIFKLPMPIAVGSALCQKIGTSIASFLKHRQYRHGELRVDWIMLGASLLGVDAGTRLLTWLSDAGTFTNAAGRPVSIVTITLDVCYAAMLLFAASMTVNAVRKGATDKRRSAVGSRLSAPALVRVRVPPYVGLPSVGIESVSVTVMAYIGFATGLLSGLLGIGGGVAMLPVLVYGYGFSIRDAAGTGILLLFANVLVGTFEHALRGNVDLRVALAVLAGSSIGSQIGARATARLSSQTLRVSFAALLLFTVGAIGVDVVRSLS